MKLEEEKFDQLLTRGVDEVIDREHLKKKLRLGKKLRVKLGIDPTSPNLHLGRAIPLLKLRDFQELGHQVVLIIGDFTGVIGDTSDKESERPMLDPKTIKQNMKTYAKQAGKILDMKKCEVRYNSQWLKKLGFMEIGAMADAFGLHEFESRENVNNRLASGKRVSLRELLYPLMQGYDSVAIKADVEIGGTDQRFNLLAGRSIQQLWGQEPQDIIMNPLVEGTDGRKMSSSWGNVINLLDEPDDMFGKVMSVADDLIEKYLVLLTRLPLGDIAEIKKLANPRDQKIRLAHEIVRMYHGDQAAQAAVEHFEAVFSRGEMPEEMKAFHPSKAQTPLLDLLVESGLAPSKSEAKRLVQQGGVKVNGKVQGDWQEAVNAQEGTIIQVGKRHFVKLR